MRARSFFTDKHQSTRNITCHYVYVSYGEVERKKITKRKMLQYTLVFKWQKNLILLSCVYKSMRVCVTDSTYLNRQMFGCCCCCYYSIIYSTLYTIYIFYLLWFFFHCGCSARCVVKRHKDKQSIDVVQQQQRQQSFMYNIHYVSLMKFVYTHI